MSSRSGARLGSDMPHRIAGQRGSPERPARRRVGGSGDDQPGVPRVREGDAAAVGARSPAPRRDRDRRRRAAVRAALEPVVGVVRPGERVCIAAVAAGSTGSTQSSGRPSSGSRRPAHRSSSSQRWVSHGGATAEGQREVLAGYGITADSMGCEIRSSMETVDLGEVRPASRCSSIATRSRERT